MGPPLALMTTLHLLGMLSINLSNLSCGNSFQAALITVHSSLTLWGFFFWTTLLRWSHKFSSGLRSGDCAGQFITVKFSSLNHCLTIWMCGRLHYPAGISTLLALTTCHVLELPHFQECWCIHSHLICLQLFKDSHPFSADATPHHDSSTSMFNSGLHTIHI